MKNVKNWNWGSFLFILLIGLLGALSNKNIPSTIDAIIFGLIIGVVVGLPIAYEGRKQ